MVASPSKLNQYTTEEGKVINVDYSSLTGNASWAIIAVVLLGAAQFDTTSKLAAAFAYLILVAAILYYGPEAVKNVNNLVGNKTTTVTANSAEGKG